MLIFFNLPLSNICKRVEAPKNNLKYQINILFYYCGIYERVKNNLRFQKFCNKIERDTIAINAFTTIT